MNVIQDQEINDSLSAVVGQIQDSLRTPSRSRFATKTGTLEELADSQRAEVSQFLRDALSTYLSRAQDRWSRAESIGPDIMWREMIVPR